MHTYVWSYYGRKLVPATCTLHACIIPLRLACAWVMVGVASARDVFDCVAWGSGQAHNNILYCSYCILYRIPPTTVRIYI